MSTVDHTTVTAESLRAAESGNSQTPALVDMMPLTMLEGQLRGRWLRHHVRSSVLTVVISAVVALVMAGALAASVSSAASLQIAPVSKPTLAITASGT